MSSVTPTSQIDRIFTMSPSLSKERPKTASTSRPKAGTPSPIHSRSSTPIPTTITPMEYSFTFPCKTCMIKHTVTYIQKDAASKDYSVSSPNGCFKAFEAGKSMLNNLLKELK